jgi:hypothetical protein
MAQRLQTHASMCFAWARKLTADAGIPMQVGQRSVPDDPLP